MILTNLIHELIKLWAYDLGFGTFGKTIPTNIIDSEENEATTQDNKLMQDLMGISSFGRKAQSFDINVSCAYSF